MEQYVSLRGSIEREGEKLVLRVPLSAGGKQLNRVASGISVIDGDDLVINVPTWLAEKIEISEGSQVNVDDRDGIFNINKVS